MRSWLLMLWCLGALGCGSNPLAPVTLTLFYSDGTSKTQAIEIKSAASVESQLRPILAEAFQQPGPARPQLVRWLIDDQRPVAPALAKKLGEEAAIPTRSEYRIEWRTAGPVIQGRHVEGRDWMEMANLVDSKSTLNQAVQYLVGDIQQIQELATGKK